MKEHIFLSADKRSTLVRCPATGYIYIDEASPLTKAQMNQIAARMNLHKEIIMDAKNCIFRDIVIYGQRFIAGCVPIANGEVITFKHDKNNIHDAFGVKAYNKNDKSVGWVPKEISPAIARMLRDGYEVTGIAGHRATRMWAQRDAANFACDVFAKKVKKGKSCK